MAATPPHAKVSRPIRLLLVGVAVVLGVLILAAVVAGVTLVKPYRAANDGMSPALQKEDRFLVWKGSSAQGGDIVTINAPTGAIKGTCGEPVPKGSSCPAYTGEPSGVAMYRRAIAFGGDRVRIEGGRAIVNGQPLDEPYARLDPDCELCNLPREITVPAGEVFLLGDNRGVSEDSRAWGPVPVQAVTGRAFARYWPPSRVGGL